MNLLSIFTLLFISIISHNFYLLHANIRKARKSGLTYIISPVYPFSRIWLTLSSLVAPLLRKCLPAFVLEPWLSAVEPDSGYVHCYSIYERLGADTYLIVTPGGNVLYNVDADVNAQITSRRNDFPKPIAMYKSLSIYGRNVVATEGHEWRRHRKITAPPFNEKSNKLVWEETLYQTGEMLKAWTKDAPAAGRSTTNVPHDTMRLSLHVISRAGFDVQCQWPSEQEDGEKDKVQRGMDTNLVPEGYTMSYVESMEGVLRDIILIMLVPDWVVRAFGWRWKSVVRAKEAYVQWGKYTRSIYDSKKTAIIESLEKAAQIGSRPSSSHGHDDDLMDAMIIGSGLIPKTPSNPSTLGTGLAESEIMGNSFIFMVAGHETTANTINHAILYLALNPSIQRHLQRDIDAATGGKPPSEWDYDHTLMAFFGSMPAAVMNEVLRLIPPAINIPKSTDPKGPEQPLKVDGKTCAVPPGTYINLAAVNVHRNPKYWPHGPPRTGRPPVHPRSNTTNDLEEFKPERWLRVDAPLSSPALPHQNGHHTKIDSLTSNMEKSPFLTNTNANANSNDDDTSMNIDTAADTAPSLFQPRRGAFIPFSEGYRACLGRRFAQIEVLTAIAVLFATHSVELCVGEFVDEKEVGVWAAEAKEKARSGDRDGYGEGTESVYSVPEEGVKAWERARDAAEKKLRESMRTVITIQMRGVEVGLVWRKRGEEVFGSCG
ncbi:cytochrome P450 [Aulographum hederae CBS 113979]|uniref:Cytochrome P450 n=1 Tax=Aulographum hederae CBS 113979 TaxID=1176131 RepID=A0A6G1HG71_9PEZI|nr:cytochrome P450 [Aulographum hederae CBS 113979]